MNQQSIDRAQRNIRACRLHHLRVPWLVALLAIAGCERESNITQLPEAPPIPATQLIAGASANDDAVDLSPRLLRRFAPISKPASGTETPVVALGRMLFYEPLLSRTGKVSCNTCHPLARYGTTNTRVSTGVDGKLGRRNAPTVYNVGGLARQFWDGRAATLEEQALRPINNPDEMGMAPGQAERVLRAIAGYRTTFAAAFRGSAQPITNANMATALAAFERGLIIPARWDQYLNGRSDALTLEEKAGAKLFANLGCMVCHTGANVGGTMFEKVGVFTPWPNQHDHGRLDVTHNPGDDMVFKVPSLRNVARTAPYFHDGSIASLDTAVHIMAHYQLGLELTEAEAHSIAAWLGSLTGELPTDYIAAPELPAAQRP